jgi:Fur family peroxide stress response transcriptional regulator
MKNIREVLAENGLKVTPQRLAVYDAISKLKNHPTADNLIDFVKKDYPNIAIGTVYNTLDTFVQKNIIVRIKTDGDVMRYDTIHEKHHHLYSSDTRRIEDFYDDELNRFISDFISKRNIPNFIIEDVNIQIVGKFSNEHYNILQ